MNDNQDAREALTWIFRESGYDVLQAKDGAEGLAMLRGGASACIILLDLMMPTMDGFQFRREQLADAEIAHIPVVVMSAVDDVGNRAASLNANAYVQVPAEIGRLIEIIDVHCLK